MIDLLEVLKKRATDWEGLKCSDIDCREIPCYQCPIALCDKINITDVKKRRELNG